MSASEDDSPLLDRESGGVVGVGGEGVEGGLAGRQGGEGGGAEHCRKRRRAGSACLRKQI